LRRKGIEALAHPRVTGHAFNAIDGLQIACCPLFVKGEQGRCFEGKHGKRRHQRIVPGNLHLVNAVIRDVGEVLVQQAEERIGTEMFASFWHHSRHRNPQHDVIHERHHSHESRIVAFMFTKSQLEGWRDYWDLLTSGNCWIRYSVPAPWRGGFGFWPPNMPGTTRFDRAAPSTNKCPSMSTGGNTMGNEADASKTLR